MGGGPLGANTGFRVRLLEIASQMPQYLVVIGSRARYVGRFSILEWSHDMLMLLQLQRPSTSQKASQAFASAGVPGVISCGVIMFTL